MNIVLLGLSVLPCAAISRRRTPFRAGCAGRGSASPAATHLAGTAAAAAVGGGGGSWRRASARLLSVAVAGARSANGVNGNDESSTGSMGPGQLPQSLQHPPPPLGLPPPAQSHNGSWSGRRPTGSWLHWVQHAAAAAVVVGLGLLSAARPAGAAAAQQQGPQQAGIVAVTAPLPPAAAAADDELTEQWDARQQLRQQQQKDQQQQPRGWTETGIQLAAVDKGVGACAGGVVVVGGGGGGGGGEVGACKRAVWD